MAGDYTAERIQYKNNIEMLLQDKGGRLKPHVRIEDLTGEKARYDRMPPVAAQKKKTRHGDTPNMSGDLDFRWVHAEEYEYGKLLDKGDIAKMVNDPSSTIVESAVNAFRRSQDDEVRDAFFADAYAGKEGLDKVVFPTAGTKSQVIPVTEGSGSAESPLSTAKIEAGKALFMSREVDADEEMCLLFHSSDFKALCKDPKVTSKDYDRLQDFQNGQIVKYMGVNLVPFERVLTLADGTRRIPMWVKSGIILAIPKDVETKVGERPDKSYDPQVYAYQRIGAVRSEEGKVIDIRCKG